MNKKYKLTEESINFFYKKLYRIEALKDFSEIKKGDKGGYVESENNLSHTGNCWIYDNAKVFDNAYICDNARVFNDAEISDNAKIYGNALIYNKARVFDIAKVYNNARVYDNAFVGDEALVADNAKIYNNAKIYGNAVVYGNARVYGNAIICRNAVVKNNSDYIIFKNWWSSGRFFTWTRSNNMWKVGCFCGTGEELIAKAYEDSELSGREYKRIVDYVESIYKFLI